VSWRAKATAMPPTPRAVRMGVTEMWRVSSRMRMPIVVTAREARLWVSVVTGRTLLAERP